MRTPLFSILAIWMVVTGCLPAAPPPANELPIAYIDSVSPSQVSPGETVAFKGHGTDRDGDVVAYQWRSSIDWELSALKQFETSSLSEGAHTVYFRVQDDNEDWSEEIYRQITVLPGGIAELVVNSFDASPGSIFKGESSTLSWNVSGATVVSIAPGMGNVAVSGTRVVSPSMTTTYTLIATNRAGSASAEAEVMVIPGGLHTVTLFSIAAEDGHVKKDGDVGPDPNVGDTRSNIAMQAFLSFDVSMIPGGATIKSASLDLSAGGGSGDPFAVLGVMGVFNDQYGDLDTDDFAVCPPPKTRMRERIERFSMGEAMYTFSSKPIGPFGSSALTSAIQTQIDAGSPRFQVRVQFEKYFYWNLVHDPDYTGQRSQGEPDCLALGAGKPKLVIEYED